MAINTVYQYCDEWETPQALFDTLNEEFHFEIDLAATSENAKCEMFYDRYLNALTKEWSLYDSCFLNPPFGQGNRALPAWIEKAATCGTTVVMILPAKVEVKWFHRWIWDQENHRPYPGVEVRFMRGRVKFANLLKPDAQAPPGASMIVVFRGQQQPWPVPDEEAP